MPIDVGNKFREFLCEKKRYKIKEVSRMSLDIKSSPIIIKAFGSKFLHFSIHAREGGSQ